MPAFAAKDLYGIIPPTTTPFTAKGTIDERAFRAQLRFMLKAGAHGLAVGGSTGEGHALNPDELHRLLAVAMEEADGKVPVVAGIIVDSTAEAIERGKAAAGAGCAALQITPVHYLFRPDDDHMEAHFRTVGTAVKLPIIIYNVVPWSYLSPALLVRIMKRVPQVVGVKQSAGDLKLFADLMASKPAGSRIFSAVDALMYPSFALQADGAIAAILSAAPKPCVDLWDAVKANDHKAALRLHKRLLALWNAMHVGGGHNLPAAVKCALTLQGVPGGRPKMPMPAAYPPQERAIARALKPLA
jgi:4-hydroxy-tetrahydrodipicolinate synthase